MAPQSGNIYWIRQDLRLTDNPALCAALAHSGEEHTVIPVYIWAPHEEGQWPPGGATRVWLHHSLTSLAADLEKLGSRLVIINTGPDQPYGGSLEALQAVAEQFRSQAVFWNRRYEPAIIERDKAIKASLKEAGLTVSTSNGALLKEPWQVSTKEGNPYQVFTPFWRTCLAELNPDPPLPAPRRMPPVPSSSGSIRGECAVGDLKLLPTIAWDGGIKESWQPGEQGAAAQLALFLKGALAEYLELRDRPDRQGVSRMSPYLHFGEISPRQIWYAVQERKAQLSGDGPKSSAGYLRELGWREFSHHLLYHFPHTTTRPLREEFEKFPWQEDPQALKIWQRGMTGYPIVDAGMRELWHTGIMHNRVRMIVASFLVKDLRLPWLEGANWFWDTLVDADLAQNTMGWQWAAGCGADAAPYFRVFNPILQGEKFDPDGIYVRRWIPELAALKTQYIHKPWEAPPIILASAGITLGETYPAPIVDHGEARNYALAAFQHLKSLREPKADVMGKSGQSTAKKPAKTR